MNKLEIPEKLIIMEKIKKSLTQLQHDAIVINRDNREQAFAKFMEIAEIGFDVFQIESDKTEKARDIFRNGFEEIWQHARNCKLNIAGNKIAVATIQAATSVLIDDREIASNAHTKITEVGIVLTCVKSEDIEELRRDFDALFDKGWNEMH